MLVGVTSSVWLYSGKTLVSWRMFVERFQGNGNAAGGAGVGGAGGLGVGVNNMSHGLSVNNKINVRGRGQAYV